MADSPEDLDAQVRRTDPDRWLSSRFVAEPAARAHVIAIYAYDYELARAPRVASNSLLGEIRLTWWREVLDEIFEGRAVRMHPTAQALAAAVRAHDLARARLETMIDARYRELDPAAMNAEEALSWARDSAGAAARLAAGLLDPNGDTAAAGDAGAAWALARRAGAGGADAHAFAEALAGLWPQARRGARSMPVAAFPAIAHAALVDRLAAGGRPADWAVRLRLVWAVARGRL
ncbi:MAG: squalene/phytoene synthase family protein [Phenylobacterium sp.]|uniref:squalene/phytoene synthase family protein n=1 Tax=Phenylobacterium sp. TaxID=1871053 RepID=UPI00391C2C12